MSCRARVSPDYAFVGRFSAPGIKHPARSFVARKFFLREFSRASRKSALLPAAFVAIHASKLVFREAVCQLLGRDSSYQLRVISFRIEIPCVTKRAVPRKRLSGTCAFYLKTGDSSNETRKNRVMGHSLSNLYFSNFLRCETFQMRKLFPFSPKLEK